MYRIMHCKDGYGCTYQPIEENQTEYKCLHCHKMHNVALSIREADEIKMRYGFSKLKNKKNFT